MTFVNHQCFHIHIPKWPLEDMSPDSYSWCLLTRVIIILSLNVIETVDPIGTPSPIEKAEDPGAAAQAFSNQNQPPLNRPPGAGGPDAAPAAYGGAPSQGGKPPGAYGPPQAGGLGIYRGPTQNGAAPPAAGGAYGAPTGNAYGGGAAGGFGGGAYRAPGGGYGSASYGQGQGGAGGAGGAYGAPQGGGGYGGGGGRGYGQPAAGGYGQAPRYSGAGAGPIVRNDAPPKLVPINSLNSYQNRWTIRARVQQKSEIRRFSNARGDGKCVSSPHHGPHAHAHIQRHKNQERRGRLEEWTDP
jgi:hypothetical protein